MSGDHNQYQKPEVTPEVTPEEEEAWLLLEKSQAELRQRDVARAATFVREHAEGLDKMTIREAP